MKRRTNIKNLKRRNNIKVLLIFELLYKVAFLTLMYRAFQASLGFLLKANGYSYLTMENMVSFLRRPVTILAIVLLFFLCTFFYLIEAVALIVFYQGYIKNKELQVMQILFPAVRETLHLLKKKGRLGVMAFAFINAVVTLLPMLVAFSIRLKVPAHIARTVISRAIGIEFVIVLAVLCLVVHFGGLYALYYCVLGDCHFLEGYKKSVRTIQKHFFQLIPRLLGVNLLLAAAYALLYIVVLLFVCYILYYVKDEAVLMAAMLTAYDEVIVYMGVFIAVANQIVNYAVLSSFYYKCETQVIFAERVEGLQEQITYEEEEQWLEYTGKKTFVERMHGWYTRMTVLIVAAIFLFNIVSIYDAFRNGSLADKETLFGTYITAHRGDSTDAPENTLPALELAIENMADYAEIDLQETRDGVIILMHDLNLKRTTGRNALVSSLTYEEILQLDAGSWFSKDFAGTYVPTFQEAIELCKGRINLNIELKVTKSAARNEELVKRVLDIIDEYDLEGQCVISCTDQAMLARVKEYNDRIKTGYILAFAYGNFYNNDYIDFFSMKYSFVSEGLVRTIHSLGKEVHAWTVNSQSDMERMKQLGVDNIITDRAVLAREVVYGEDLKMGFFKLIGIIQK